MSCISFAWQKKVDGWLGLMWLLINLCLYVLLVAVFHNKYQKHTREINWDKTLNGSPSPLEDLHPHAKTLDSLPHEFHLQIIVLSRD